MATAAQDPTLSARGGLSTALLIIFGFGAGIGVGCATSDNMMEGQLELQAVQGQRRKPADCKPGRVEPCYGGPETTAGRGICTEGTRTCTEAGQWLECAKEVTPLAESCNGVDDDCDGIVDNGFERHGALCWRGKGACRSQGSWTCSKDQASSECSAAIVQPSAEVCDKVDNDCNGEIDDGDIQGTGEKCSTGKAGACAAGAKRCVGGAIRCVQLATPTTEICNQIDDDCDNQVDDDCVSAEEAAKRTG